MSYLLHIAHQAPDKRIWNPVFINALQELGQFKIVSNGENLSDHDKCELIRKSTILITSWNSARVPDQILKDKGNLKYICHVTGELSRFIPLDLVDNGVQVTNWGDYPADKVAEGALTLTLAGLKDVHHQIMTIRKNGWRMDMHAHGGSLSHSQVGIYGYGVIGKRYVELLEPFNCKIKIFDPFVDQIPEHCESVDNLEDLFKESQVLAIHCALTDDTKNSVTADLLSLLPRHALVINVARGGIVDQDALFKELESGRLRAALDVLEPDSLPLNHPARSWENLILSAHRIYYGWPDFNEEAKQLNEMQKIAIDNIRSFQNNKPLKYRMDRERYLRST